MDYIELNAIPEVASSDEEPLDLIQLTMKITLDDGSETPETPLSALFRQESVRSRYEFSRQDSYKQKPPAIDTFPSIRGLEYESAKPVAEVPKRRPSGLIKNSFSDHLRVDSEREIKNPDDDLKSIASENTEKTFSRRGSKRSKTFNAAENIETLRNIIVGKPIAPETMLIAAIGSIYEVDLNSRRKDIQLIDLASNNLEHVNMKYDQVIMYQEEIHDDLIKLEQKYAESQEQTLKIEEDMNKCKNVYTENRISLENKLKTIHHRIYLAMNGQEKLGYSLKDTSEWYETMLNENFEIEERCKMNIEDLQTNLHIIESSRIKQEKMCEDLQEILDEIKNERAKKKMLKEKIRICTESLCEVTGYLNDSKIKKELALEFSELLSSIKKEISDGIKAEKNFEINAVTDPKSIMPYFRASDTCIN
ncbi:hypothetical protein SteCoe_11009 [Stentor coeruleus]|uniref:Uncharacterized protein n=1 Tax=Stentor coeruleus TaxID=5963 RepID=A0A1R2CE91_9CILI|nr:hypothetical protein SteCoe_11009 [Stentor coeruleus]